MFHLGAERFVEQVGVALRCLNLQVAEELADHRQRHAAGNLQRCEGVVQIMDADAGQFGLRPPIFPKKLNVLQVLAFGVPRETPFRNLREALVEEHRVALLEAMARVPMDA